MTTNIRLAIMSVSLILSCAPPFMQSASSQTAGQTGANGPADQNVDHPRLRKLRERMMDGNLNNPGILGAPDPKGGPGGRRDSIAAPGGATGANPGPGLGLGPGGQAGGDTDDRRKERRERMLKRFDADGDGVLSDSEKAKMRAWIQERRAQRAAQGQGGPGPGPLGGQGRGLRQGGAAGSAPANSAPTRPRLED